MVGMLLADVAYLVGKGMGLGDFWALLRTPEVRAGIRMSLISSAITLLGVPAVNEIVSSAMSNSLPRAPVRSLPESPPPLLPGPLVKYAN